MSSLESTLEAGRLYRSTGAIEPNLLRPHVFRGWERSHLGGADPRRPQAEALSLLDVERLRGQHQALIQAAQPYMGALSRAAGSEHHAAMLGDTQAVVLDVLGDEQTVHGPGRVPGPGALLDEALCGANGIGTALAEGGYVELVGPEHFVQGLQLFTCHGVPLYDGTGATAGVLSVSVRRLEVGYRLREIMLCAAHAIEMELLSARLEQDLRRVFEAPGAAAEALKRLLDDTLQAQTAVRVRLDFAAEQFSQSHLTHARELLALTTQVLSRFRRHAALWRGLALDEPAAPRPLALDAVVRELVDMLEVEATVCAVEVILQEVEPVVIEADLHGVTRSVFRCLFGAIQATRGGAIHVNVRQTPAGGELRVVLAPGAGMAQETPEPVCLVVPSVPQTLVV